MVSNKNQGPLKDAVGREARKHTVEEELRIAEAVIERLGTPPETLKEGAKITLQPKKASRSNPHKRGKRLKLRKTLHNNSKTTTTTQRTEEARERGEEPKSPCSSQLHWAWPKSPKNAWRKPSRS
jgi:hypothetical protein